METEARLFQLTLANRGKGYSLLIGNSGEGIVKKLETMEPSWCRADDIIQVKDDLVGEEVK